MFSIVLGVAVEELMLEQAKLLYARCFTLRQIAMMLSCDINKLNRRLREAGVIMNNRTSCNRRLREDFFGVIDSAEKAYWLGVVMTDGNIYEPKRFPNSRVIQFHIQMRDSAWLEKFRVTIGWSRPLRKTMGEKYSSVTLAVNSVQMANDLGLHGVLPRKSLHEIFPPSIPASLQSHFVRGVFDGDGGITAPSSLYFYGGVPFLTEISAWWCMHQVPPARIYLKKTNLAVGQMSYTGRERVQRMLSVLYSSGGVVCLDRKKERARELGFVIP